MTTVTAKPGTLEPQRYRWSQIAMHWLIVGLVLVQYSTSGAIVRSHQIHMIGQKMEPLDMVLHTIHNRAGLAIVALMVLRLASRWYFGVPHPVTIGAPWRTRTAMSVHLAFYVVLIAEGLTGAVASYLWWPISAAHVILFKILLALISVHIAAALWHQLVMRDQALKRIIVR